MDNDFSISVFKSPAVSPVGLTRYLIKAIYLIRIYFQHGGKGDNSKKPAYRDNNVSLSGLMKEHPEHRAEAKQVLQFLNAQKLGEHEAELEKIKNVFLAILRDIKKDMDNGEKPGEAVTAAMFQNIQTAAQEQKQELHTIDDVTALVVEQLEKVMPLDDETSEQFQQLMKKMIEQVGK